MHSFKEFIEVARGLGIFFGEGGDQQFALGTRECDIKQPSLILE